MTSTTTVTLTNVALPGFQNSFSGEVILLPERIYHWEESSDPAEIIDAFLTDDVSGAPLSAVLSEEAYRALLAAAVAESKCYALPAKGFETELPF